MTTDAQQAANEQNARKSTGPRSAAGKARSSANAIVHGAYTNRVDLISSSLLKENISEVVGLFNAIVTELAPSSVLEQAAARSVAHRILGQARANRLAGALIDGAAVSEEPPLTAGTARFYVAVAGWLFMAITVIRGEAPDDPEPLARLIHSQMKEERSLLIRVEGEHASRRPATDEEWRTMLRELIRIEYGGPEGAEHAALALLEQHGPESKRENSRRVGAEASRILAVFRDVTALHDRVDRLVARALSDYYDLQDTNADSPYKLLLNGTIDGSILGDDAYEDEYDEDENAYDKIEVDDGVESRARQANSRRADSDGPPRPSPSRNEPN